jgi:hypothetical protein
VSRVDFVVFGMLLKETARLMASMGWGLIVNWGSRRTTYLRRHWPV